MQQEMIDISIDLFEKQGFKETSIQDIVSALGVTKGTFYYYFSSKETLLMEIHRSYIDEILEQQQTILKNEDATDAEKLKALIHQLITSIEPKGDSARVFFREFRHLSREHLDEVLPKRDQVRLNFEQVIRDGMQHGVFRPELNPVIVTLGILGACNWTYQWFDADGSTSADEVAAIYVDYMLHGLNKNEGG
ncbi:TetR family transcriptional regulator [Salsuginibacillus halophilus]|uniref:TetR family transcriptional regulator n=1 Tax=Salsuginibacillus halophilus TaxID=517424 RepID=A0A2P8HBK8_9BACI|nr:TetR/AcrR family transcriptional regulator [Salsuginibacillus halophilus]PSL43609.1 TetR family transcriptional regulator [Salsuginibacillus halophilus]